MKLNWRSVSLALLFGLVCFFLGAYFLPFESGLSDTQRIAAAEKLIGLDFSAAQRKMMQPDVAENLQQYRDIRKAEINNGLAPALDFDPVPPGMTFPSENLGIKLDPVGPVTRPANLEEVAFFPIRKLAELIRTRQVSSEELTRMYIDRLKRYDPQLHCVISLTEDIALEQARRADREIADGKYRGPLHGIPYGLKDLFAVKGTRTTWGARPYQDQVIDTDSTVYQRLEAAGAVLVAKLSLGALAMGDVWFGGKTRDPWNPKKGSSGSSAGPASATSAGLVGFAIGTETWGSIVSPSTQCGVTGLRPTYGRVSRTGAMALSWSMDKVGPICRSVEGCALVFDAIRGPDGLDRTLRDLPFNYRSQVDLGQLRIGYVKSLFDKEKNNKANDMATLKKLRELGAKLVPVELPDTPVEPLSIILNAEGAAAFDELTRSGRDKLMVRQGQYAWPNVFRVSRLIPAVEYIQANRLRLRLIEKMGEFFKNLDVYVAPSFGGNNLLLTNLSGHPAVVVPNGFNKEGNPTSITVIGALYNEADALAVAGAYQAATDFNRRQPPKFAVTKGDR